MTLIFKLGLDQSINQSINQSRYYEACLCTKNEVCRSRNSKVSTNGTDATECIAIYHPVKADDGAAGGGCKMVIGQ